MADAPALSTRHRKVLAGLQASDLSDKERGVVAILRDGGGKRELLALASLTRRQLADTLDSVIARLEVMAAARQRQMCIRQQNAREQRRRAKA